MKLKLSLIFMCALAGCNAGGIDCLHSKPKATSAPSPSPPGATPTGTGGVVVPPGTTPGGSTGGDH